MMQKRKKVFQQKKSERPSPAKNFVAKRTQSKIEVEISDTKFKVVLHLKIFKISNFFLLNFLIIYLVSNLKKSGLDEKFLKFYIVISKRI